MPVKIVTDTGCDLPPALIEQYDIHLVPLILRFGDRDMLDSETTRQELWQRVEAGLPCETSGPPVGPYEVMFNSLVEAGHDVVCITLTGAHSVTYNERVDGSPGLSRPGRGRRWALDIAGLWVASDRSRQAGSYRRKRGGRGGCGARHPTAYHDPILSGNAGSGQARRPARRVDAGVGPAGPGAQHPCGANGQW